MAKVKVGVAWRRDGQNQAHAGDLAVFSHPGLQNDVQVYTLAWAGAQTVSGLGIGQLSDMDLLVIPGGPHANATQIPVHGQAVVNAAQGNTAGYADARARSELDLIEQARTLGMPILALCGGSWRLVQNYGGSTVELAALDTQGKLITDNSSNNAARLRHAGNMNNVATEFKHPMDIRPSSLLQNATTTGRYGKRVINPNKTSTYVPSPGFKPPTQMQVNSVHWAAVRTAGMGTRQGLGQQPFEVVPNNMLTMTGRDPSALGTSEAVESQHGAPVLGVQWHPEYQLPVEGGQNPAARTANLALLQWMVKAGRAYRAHRDAMQELLGLVKPSGDGVSPKGVKALVKKFNALGEQAKGPAPGTAQAVRFRGAPVHTGGAPGVGPLARTIPRHKDDDAPPSEASNAEQAVRSYLFNLGRKKGSLFLSPGELFNLASGAPLSRVRDDGELRKQPVVTFMSQPQNVWAQKYCNDASKAAVLKWP